MNKFLNTLSLFFKLNLTTQPMNYLKLGLLGLIISFNVSAQTQKRIIKLSGSIDDKYAILMTLAIEGEKVLGYYYYDKYKSKLLLEGSIQENKVVLNESPGYKREFEVGFIGDLNDNSLTGVWMDKAQNKTMNFSTLIYADVQENKEEKVAELEGNFESIHNSEKFISSVELEHIADHTFCFRISNGTESGCVGYLKGLIELKNLKQGRYSEESCEEIQFTYANQELYITENNCEHHGMRCPFEGRYKKK
jgi:hypothetical protein